MRQPYTAFRGIDWDNQLPENILDTAKKWFAEDLGNIKIDRCLRGLATQQGFIQAKLMSIRLY